MNGRSDYNGPIGLDAELSELQEDVVLANVPGGSLDGVPMAAQHTKSKPSDKLFMEHAGTQFSVLPRSCL